MEKFRVVGRNVYDGVVMVRSEVDKVIVERVE